MPLTTLIPLTNTATIWKRGAKDCAKDFGFEKCLKNISQYIADFNKKSNPKTLDKLDAEIQKAAAAAAKITASMPRKNIKEATSEAVEELADLAKDVAAARKNAGKTQTASQAKIQQFVAYRAAALDEAKALATGVARIKSDILARAKSINDEIDALRKSRPGYIVGGAGMQAIRKRLAQLQGDYAGLEKTILDFTNEQNKNHRSDAAPLNKFDITDPADLALAKSLDAKAQHWPRMDAFAKEADIAAKSLAPLLDKLALAIESSESRIEERNEFWNETLDKTRQMLLTAKAAMTKAVSLTGDNYAKNYAESAVDQYLDDTRDIRALDAALPSEIEAFKRAQLATIGKVRAELQDKTKAMLDILSSASASRDLVIKRLPKTPVLKPDLYEDELSAMDDEYKQVAARLLDIQQKWPRIQATYEARIKAINNYKSDIPRPAKEYIKPAAFVLADGNYAKNKTIQAFCARKEFTQFTLTGAKPALDGELAAIQKAAAAKLKNFASATAALEKLRNQKMTKDAAQKAVRTVLYQIGDATGTMSDGLQAQMTYWSKRCAELYKDDSAARKQHDAGTTVQIIGVLGGVLANLAKHLSDSEIALDQS